MPPLDAVRARNPVAETADGRDADYRPLLYGSALATVTVVTLLLFLHARSGTALAQKVGDVAIMVAVVLAGLVCARAARRSGPDARGWALLTVGMSVWAAGNAMWTYYGFTRDHVYPFPSLADLGFIGYSLPVAAGLLAFPRVGQKTVSRARVALDGLLIASAVLFVSLATFLVPLLSGAGPGRAHRSRLPVRGHRDRLSGAHARPAPAARCPADVGVPGWRAGHPRGRGQRLCRTGRQRPVGHRHPGARRLGGGVPARGPVHARALPGDPRRWSPALHGRPGAAALPAGAGRHPRRHLRRGQREARRPGVVRRRAAAAGDARGAAGAGGSGEGHLGRRPRGDGDPAQRAAARCRRTVRLAHRVLRRRHHRQDGGRGGHELEPGGRAPVRLPRGRDRRAVGAHSRPAGPPGRRELDPRRGRRRWAPPLRDRAGAQGRRHPARVPDGLADPGRRPGGGPVRDRARHHRPQARRGGAGGRPGPGAGGLTREVGVPGHDEP